MRTVSSGPWLVLTRVLQTLGVIGCTVVFGWTLVLTEHYTATRPYGSVPQRGWTVGLPWCLGRYGTFEEKQQLLRLQDWFFPFFFCTCVGTGIRQLRVKPEPWKRNL